MRSWVLIVVMLGNFAAGWIAAGPRRIAPASASPAPVANTYTVRRESGGFVAVVIHDTIVAEYQPSDGVIYRKLAAEARGIETPAQTTTEGLGFTIASRGGMVAGGQSDQYEAQLGLEQFQWPL